MYIILWWQMDKDNYFTAILTEDGQIKLYGTLAEAKSVIKAHPKSEELRVTSIEEVKEA